MSFRIESPTRYPRITATENAKNETLTTFARLITSVMEHRTSPDKSRAQFALKGVTLASLTYPTLYLRFTYPTSSHPHIDLNLATPDERIIAATTVELAMGVVSFLRPNQLVRGEPELALSLETWNFLLADMLLRIATPAKEVQRDNL